MTKQEESLISELIKDYLNSKRIFNRRNQAIATSYGLPDREFLYKGVNVGIEVKTSTGTAKAHQKHKLKQFNDNGGVGVVVRSVDEVKFIIKLIDDYYDIYIENCYSLDSMSILLHLDREKPWLTIPNYVRENFNREYPKNNV